jgi:hypothetical protein
VLRLLGFVTILVAVKLEDGALADHVTRIQDDAG